MAASQTVVEKGEPPEPPVPATRQQIGTRFPLVDTLTNSVLADGYVLPVTPPPPAQVSSDATSTPTLTPLPSPQTPTVTATPTRPMPTDTPTRTPTPTPTCSYVHPYTDTDTHTHTDSHVGPGKNFTVGPVSEEPGLRAGRSNNKHANASSNHSIGRKHLLEQIAREIPSGPQKRAGPWEPLSPFFSSFPHRRALEWRCLVKSYDIECSGTATCAQFAPEAVQYVSPAGM
jgi:hypothetical protein